MDKKFFLFLVILSVFLLVECGRRKHRHHKHRHCPSRDDVDHVCCEWEYHSYLMTYKTCTKCKGNDPQDSSQTCKPWRRRPHCLYYYTVNVTTVSCQPKCCEGWTEDEYGDCTISTDDEQQITCENGGTPAGDSCNCPIGFVGVRCEKAVCTPPCLNNGMCSGKDGQPVCVCPEGRFTGPQCETPVCDPACKNGGSCVAGAYSSYCTCPSGYEGDSCENKVKDGDCPSPTGAGICADTCSSDSHCHGEQKCCRNGCGARVCMAAAKDTCYLNGTEYPVGHLMKRDPCTMCFCKDPNSYDPWECVSTSCPRLTCTHTKMIPNKCCAVCEVTTTTPAPTTRVPTTITKTTTTTTTTTPAPTTRVPATTTKTTTTTTQMLYDGCFENGVKYPLGHVINKNNNCDTCTCIYPQYYLLPDWQCKRVDCPSYLNCKNFTQIPGQCCPVCNDSSTSTPRPTTPKPVCHHDGIEYPPYHTLKKTDCETCYCNYLDTGGLDWNCMVMDCAPTSCTNYITVPGQCCPICPETPKPASTTMAPSCVFNNTKYPHMSVIRQEPCQICTCRYLYGGYLGWNCVTGRCNATTTTPPSPTTYKPVCHHNGVEYPLYSRLNRSDCEICTCNYVSRGVDWSCMIIDCLRPQCENFYSIPGQCCPVCPDTTPRPTTARPTTQRPPLHEGPLFKTCPSEQIIVHTHQERIVHIRSQVNLTVTDKSGRLYTITYSKETIEAVACSCSSNIHIITAQSEPDRYGRFASCVFTVKVVDNHPPMFSTCPSNFAAFEDEVISWDEPKATDNVGIKETQFISELPNNSIFPKGHHALVYIATDHDGNVGACRFLISIYSRDTTDPSAPLEIKNAGDDHDKGILINIIIGVLAALIILTIAIIMSVCFYRYKKQVRQRHEQASSAGGYDNGIYATPRTPPPSYSQASVKKLPPKYMLNDEKPPLYEELDVKVFSKKGVQNPIYDSSDELDVRDIRLKLRMREHTDA